MVAFSINLFNRESDHQAKAKQTSATLGEAVYKQIQISFEKIPYETKTIEDSSLQVNTKQVQVKGVNGTQTVTYELIYNQNGDLIDKKTIKTEVTKKSITEVVKIGTRSQITSQVQGVNTGVEVEPTPEPTPDPTPDCTDGFYSETYKHCVPKGATAMCNDGTYRYISTTRCIANNGGGIKEWYL